MENEEEACVRARTFDLMSVKKKMRRFRDERVCACRRVVSVLVGSGVVK